GPWARKDDLPILKSKSTQESCIRSCAISRVWDSPSWAIPFTGDFRPPDSGFTRGNWTSHSNVAARSGWKQHFQEIGQPDSKPSFPNSTHSNNWSKRIKR